MRELFDLQAWQQVWVEALSDLATTLAAFLPKFAGALVILAVGWVLSRAIEIAVRRALHALGLDRASERLRIADVLARSGIGRSLSGLIARLLFWLLMLTFVVSAVDVLGLRGVTATLDRLIAFIPGLIGAGLILVLGLLAARFAGGVVASTAAAAGLAAASRIGWWVQALVVALVAVVAVEQVGVATAVLVGPLTALLAAVALSAGLAFALGARPIITHILAGHFLKQSLPRDGVVEVAGRRGVVQRVGATDTLLRNDDGSWSVPNAQLLEQVITR